MTQSRIAHTLTLPCQGACHVIDMHTTGRLILLNHDWRERAAEQSYAALTGETIPCWNVVEHWGAPTPLCAQLSGWARRVRPEELKHAAIFALAETFFLTAPSTITYADQGTTTLIIKHGYLQLTLTPSWGIVYWHNLAIVEHIFVLHLLRADPAQGVFDVLATRYETDRSIVPTLLRVKKLWRGPYEGRLSVTGRWLDQRWDDRGDARAR